jgi:hypothetical protein
VARLVAVTSVVRAAAIAGRSRVRESVRAALCDLAAQFCPDDAAALVARLETDEHRLRAVYRTIGAWPADAQFAIHTVAIVLGPGVRMPALRRIVDAWLPDFRAAADAALMQNRGHSGVVALNDRVARGFRNAGIVVQLNLNPERLYYPVGLSGGIRQ